MQVKIGVEEYGGRDGYKGAMLDLPATKAEIQDALDRARVSQGVPYSIHDFTTWPRFMWTNLIVLEGKRIEEVNFLAGQVSQMDEAALTKYEGILGCMEEGNEGGIIPMKDLINAAYNMERFEFVAGMTNDRLLGQAAMCGSLKGRLKGQPDEAIALMDAEKVGKSLRNAENGIFTDGGYCRKAAEGWKEVYDGKVLPEMPEEQSAAIALCLESSAWPLPEKHVWVALPCSGETVDLLLQSLHVKSLEECSIKETRSVVPALKGIIRTVDNIVDLNELAGKLEKMTQKELVKYKAVLEYTHCEDMEQALFLADRLDYYTFDPKQASYADYGRELLEEAGAELGDRAFLGFDFEGYGRRHCEQGQMRLTSYGMMMPEDGPEEMQEQDDSQQMGGM